MVIDNEPKGDDNDERARGAPRGICPDNTVEILEIDRGYLLVVWFI